MDSNKPKIYVVGGLLYGDEGKGTTVEYLVHSNKENCNLVVRFCGGPQAAHHVVLDNGEWHCFSQFGSASFEKNSYTLLSKFMNISPTNLHVEEEILIKKKCSQISKRLLIDKECFIVTPYHKLLNRVNEMILDEKSNGSTGLGVGVCFEDSFNALPDFFPKGREIKELNRDDSKIYTCLQVKDLVDLGDEELLKKINSIKTEKLTQYKCLIDNFKSIINQENKETIEAQLKKINNCVLEILKGNPVDKLIDFYYNFSNKFKKNFCNSEEVIYKHLNNNEIIVFEGAQGMLLDKIYGFYPHLTKSICSDDNAIKLLENIKIKYDYDYREKNEYIKLGILRAYSSRHGNGPFISLNNDLNKVIVEEHNQYNQWQGTFKIGFFDILMAKYGIEIFKPDYLVITCLDKMIPIFLDNQNKVVQQYKINKDCIDDKNKIYISISQIKDEDDYITIDKFNKLEPAYHYKINTLTNLINKCEPVHSIISYNDFKDTKEILENSNKNSDIKHKINETLSRKKQEILNSIYSNKHFINNKEKEEKYLEQLSYFISYLQNKLNKEISIISLGPTKFNKVELIN